MVGITITETELFRKIIGKDVVLNNLGSTTCEEETEEYHNHQRC